MNERDAYIALNMMEKIGPVAVRSLVSILGTAKAIFEADKSELIKAKGIGTETAETIIRQKNNIDWQKEIDCASRINVRIISCIDEEYPKPLLDIHDPPLALYVSGAIKSKDKHSIAIVGTRRATHYGLDSAERLAFQLVKAGFVVISGLAIGIDTSAHSGALKGKGRTLAVIGSGLDYIYPESNNKLAQHISEHGAVISEFPLGRKPDKTTFPMRNRIVSGLSMGVLVVEAGIKSGALITSNQALEQGRSVFAVPGRIDSYASRGTHDLIKNGAKLVETVEDILHEYEFLMPQNIQQPAIKANILPDLSVEEKKITCILKNGEIDVDGLIRASGLKPANINALLIGLEMKKIIRMLPGRMVKSRIN